MILIISQDDNEDSTNYVIDWLFFRKANFIRINGSDFESKARLAISITNQEEAKVEVNGLNMLSDSINVVWYRRWMDKDFFYDVDFGGEGDSKFHHDLSSHLFNEFGTLGHGFFKMACDNKTVLTKPSTSKVNKLDILLKAKNAGLVIPDTIITNNKKDLVDFIASKKSVISKCISNLKPLIYKNQVFTHYTIALNESSDLEKIPDEFFPSLFQEEIRKQYELRVFFLDNECYAMAIFSQQNEQSKTDFRRYDFARPVREVPYKLPVAVERSIVKLMNSIDLNCGSIDLMRSLTGEYCFLEINPIGQFGMVSYPCNYYLERKIAEYLIKNDDDKDNQIEKTEFISKTVEQFA